RGAEAGRGRRRGRDRTSRGWGGSWAGTAKTGRVRCARSPRAPRPVEVAKGPGTAEIGRSKPTTPVSAAPPESVSQPSRALDAGSENAGSQSAGTPATGELTGWWRRYAGS